MAIVCKICNKEYSSFSSRSNHIKKFHNHIDNKSSLLSEHNVNKSSLLSEHNVNKSSLLLLCQYCNKNFKFRQSKNRHEKYYCKKNNITDTNDKINILEKNKIDNITDTNDKINILEKKINDQTKEISELKELLQSSLKIY